MSISDPEQLRIHLLIELYRQRAHEVPLAYLESAARLHYAGFDHERVAAELIYLQDKGFVAWRYAELGSRKLYRITAAGVDLMERDYANFVDQSPSTGSAG